MVCLGVSLSLCLTLRLLRLEHPEETRRHEAELSLAGIGQSGDHLGHRRLSSDAGQPVVVSEQEPGGRRP